MAKFAQGRFEVKIPTNMLEKKYPWHVVAGNLS